MPRFAANLTLLFTELPMLERIAAAKAAGFDAVEILFPYEHDLSELRGALDRSGMPLVLINAPPGDWPAGERGFAAMPGAEDRFREGFVRALAAAEVLRPRFIHVMAGLAEGPEARATFVANLRWALSRAGAQRLTIEPINTVDVPGYFLDDFGLAEEVIDEIGDARLGLQFDAYHAHVVTGDAIGTWARFGPGAVHVQVSAAEGRHEPVKGAIDYPAFFARLDRDGYDGLVSAEYHPAGRTEEGLGWMRG